MKKTTVTIGIAAYNEENNIESLLRDILKQTKKAWFLKDIVVNCDGCTDRTADIARSINSKSIRVIENRDRKGKSKRVNEICQHANGEIIVFLDADVKLANSEVVERLIAAFAQNKECMVVGGNTRPFPPIGFFQRAVYSTFLVFDLSRIKIKNGNNIFGCNGGCLAVRTSFAKTLTFPNVANDDDYIYFSCIKSGYQFKHVRNAIVYYKLPTHLKDYLKQSFRV